MTKEDEQTNIYFDEFVPHFSPERLNFALESIGRYGKPDAKLIDVGCGDGSTLAYIKEKTQLTHLTGMDIGPRYIRQTKELTGCETILGSIIDQKMVADLEAKYEFCIVASVLHHLIGDNRRSSQQLAQLCLLNSWSLLKPGGFLILFEPSFQPYYLMSVVFWIKKIFSRLSNGRIEVLVQWLNIGQPIVSYYTANQIYSMVNRLDNVQILKEMHHSMRLVQVIKRKSLGLVIQKVM